MKTTTWRCLVCGRGKSFTHDGLTGNELITEVQIRHQIASPSCRFWDLKVKMRTL